MKNIAIASLMLLSSSAFAHNLPVHTNWESDYVAGKGKMSLRVTSTEDVTISEDRNACAFNYLGLIAVCTRMAPLATEGKLFQKPVATDRMTSIWEFEDRRYEVVYNLKDVNNGFIRLLKIDHEGLVVDSVRLFEK